MIKKISAITCRLLSFLPSLLLLFLIFGFSAQDGESSGSLSFQISLYIVQLFSPLLPVTLSDEVLFERANFIHIFVRKAAHMTEYFLLVLALHLPLKTYLKTKLSFSKRLLIAFFCTVFFAITDEFHQTLVPGRSGNVVDVCIDSIGALLATFLLWFLSKWIPDNKKSAL